MKHKIAVITASAPPNSGSHAQRIVSLVKTLYSRGHDVDVFIPTANDEDKLKSSLFIELTLYCRVVEVDNGTIRRVARGIGSFSKKTFISNIVQKLRSFVRRNALPDTYIGWVPKVVKSVYNESLSHHYDCIISSGAPFSSHIAAYLCSKKLDSSLVLDYGDPWVYEPGRPRKGFKLMIERKIEKKILMSSKYVSFTTEETKLLYQNKYPDVDVAMGVHYMGFSKADFKDKINKNFNKDAIELVYAGRINEEYRSLDSFLDFLNYLESSDFYSTCTIHFYGNEFASVVKLLKPYIERGLVILENNLEHSQYIHTIASANGLIIFGNDSYVQIPGKIAHYIATKRPILYFANKIPNDLDPSVNLLNKVIKKGCFFNELPNSYEEFLYACTKKSYVEVDNDNYENLEWDNTFRNFKL